MNEAEGHPGGRRYECDGCGACCRFPIVEITELDVHREPRLKTAATPFGKGHGLLAAGGSRPCPLLDGDRCSIYPSRPNCCVAFPAGSVLCQESRAAQGLPPLSPREDPS